MMAQKGLVNLKVLLKDPSSSTHEARRLELDPLRATNFLLLKEKIRNTFPSLQAVDFKITWKDADGDDITISSDEELVVAFTEMNNVKTLYASAAHARPQPKPAGEKTKTQTSENEDVDVHTLEGMAKKYLPLLAGFGACPSSSTGSASKPEDCPMNMFRNIAENFLANVPKEQRAENPQNQPGKQEDSPMNMFRNLAENFLANIPKDQRAEEPQNQPQGNSASQNRHQADLKDLKLVEALAQLEEMGFSNENGMLVRLLERFHGDVARVITAMSEA